MTDHIPDELRRQVALDQLLNPETRTLDRDPADIARQLDEEQRAYLGHVGYLAGRIRDAAQRSDLDALDRARCAIDQAGDRHRSRRAAITAVRVLLPSLLDQLLAAIDPSSDTGGTGSASPAAHRSALGIAAFDLIREIQQTVGAPNRHHLADWVRAYTGDPTTAEEWVTKAREILTPTKRWSMPGRCPNCDRGIVHVPDSSGETVRRLALELNPATAETRCLNCGTVWPPARARQLEAVLRQQHEEALAERRHAARNPAR